MADPNPDCEAPLLPEKKKGDAPPQTPPDKCCQAKRAVGYALCLLACTLTLGVLITQQYEMDSANMLTAYNGGMDSTAALKATLVDKAVLWTGSGLSAEEVVTQLAPSARSFVLVTAGPNKPARRSEHQPFLTVGQGVQLPVASINAAAEMVEGALGRRLFPLRIEAVDMPAPSRFLAGTVRPYVVWEVGSGRVLVDQWLVEQLWSDPKVQHMTGLMSRHLFAGLANTLTTVGAAKLSALSTTGLYSLMGPALSAAVAAAFAAAPPLWFCIACPAVLGLMAPLLINIGLNQLAGYLCTHLTLPDDQCFDLMLGALGLGFVLALASAIPIFYVCKLAECAHRSSDNPPAVGGGVKRGGALRVPR